MADIDEKKHHFEDVWWRFEVCVYQQVQKGIYPNAFCVLVFVKVQALNRMEMPNEHVLSMILSHFETWGQNLEIKGVQRTVWWFRILKWMGVSKNRGVSPKMDDL